MLSCLIAVKFALLVFTIYSHCSSMLSRYSYVLAPELARTYRMSIPELGYDSQTELVAVRAPLATTSGKVGDGPPKLEITPVNMSHPLEVRACTPQDFELVQLSPKLPGGW